MLLRDYLQLQLPCKWLTFALLFQLKRNERSVPQNCWLTYWVPPPSPYEGPHQPWSLSVAQSASSLHQYQCPEHPYLQTCLLHSPGTPTDSANNSQHQGHATTYYVQQLLANVTQINYKTVRINATPTQVPMEISNSPLQIQMEIFNSV